MRGSAAGGDSVRGTQGQARRFAVTLRETASCLAGLHAASDVLFCGLVRMEAAHSLVYRLQNECPILGEQVAVDVLGGLDLAVSHLVGHLHVGGTGGDHQ